MWLVPAWLNLSTCDRKHLADNLSTVLHSRILGSHNLASIKPCIACLVFDNAMWLGCHNGLLPLASLLLPYLASAQCPLYQNYAAQRHEPISAGNWSLSYARPIVPCRTFHSQEVEDTIDRLRGVIKDPDLFRVRTPLLLSISVLT